MAANLTPPARPSGTPDEQLQVMYRYLYHLTEQLNVVIGRAGESSVTVLEKALASGSEPTKTTAPKDVVDTYNQLKALIIKTATEVEASTRRIVFDMTDSYRAQSDYGTYEEYLKNEISVGADGVVMNWSAENGITTPVGDFEYSARSSAYMQLGIVRYNDDGTVEAGVVIGRELQRVELGGKELIRSGNIYCLLQADSLSFWKNGVMLSRYGLYEFFADRAYIGEVYASLLDAGSDFGARLVVKDDVISAISQNITLTADKINAVAKDIDLSSNDTVKITAEKINAVADDIDLSGNNTVRVAAGVKAGTTVEINERLVNITTPEFLVNTNGASFNIPGVGDEPQAVTIDSGGLQANKFSSPEAARAFEGGYFDSLAAAADRINGCRLTGDVVVRCQYNEPTVIFKGVSGPGKVMIAPDNLAGVITAAKFETVGGASLWQSEANIVVTSGGNAHEYVKMDVGGAGAMGIRGRRLVLSCNGGSQSSDKPAAVLAAVYVNDRWIASVNRPGGGSVTDHKYMSVSFAIPEDVGYSDRLYIYFYVSYDTPVGSGSQAAYTDIKLAVEADAAGNGSRQSLARLQIDGCTAQFALHRMMLLGLRAYYSNVTASMCSFVAMDGDDAGKDGFHMWGGSGAMDNCTSTGTLRVAAEAIGGGMMHVSGTRPAGTYRGSVNLDFSTGEDDGDSVPVPPATEKYSAMASGTYGARVGWISDNAMRQGYTDANGKMRGAVWFSGEIKEGVQRILLRLRRAEGYGRAGDVDVRIYGTTAGVRDGDPAAAGKISSESVSGKMAPGETQTFDVTGICNPVNYTAYVVMFEDDNAVMSGKTYSKNYARFTGVGGGEDTRPALTVLR